jgi:hypothetical protein
MKSPLSALAVVVATAGLAISPPSAAPAEEGSAEVEATAWQIRPRSAPTWKYTVEIEVTGGYCAGEPEPQLDHVSVRGKVPGHPRHSAAITVYVKYPGRANEAARPRESVHVCAGLGWGRAIRVKLRRPVASLYLFDGSFSPPQLVSRPTE